MYIIGFNGPPQCGKDTLSRLLTKEIESRHSVIPVLEVSLSSPLRTIAYSMVGLHYPNPALDYEDFKPTFFPQYGVTGRQLMIDVSEKFLKPTYGPRIMADLLLASLPSWMFQNTCVVMIRDCGFQIEVDPIVERVGAENFVVCKVVRDGHDSFIGDSREWVQHPWRGMNFNIYNSGSLQDLEERAKGLYEDLVRPESIGWTLA